VVLAHNCAVLQIPFDSRRLFCSPYGNYHLALHMVVEAVSETNRRERERSERK